MKSQKRYYVLIISAIVILSASTLIILNFVSDKNTPDTIKYKTYLIDIESSHYSPDTKCGRIDITITNSKNNPQKLFASKDDIMHNGNKKIVNLDYGLQIMRDDTVAECYVQELNFENNVQHIVVKYINIAETNQDNHAQIQIVKFPNTNIVKAFETPTDQETASICLSAGKKGGRIMVSSHGLFIDNETTKATHVFDILVHYKNGKENVLFYANEFHLSEKKTNYVQVAYEDKTSQNYYYCWDFGDLENVKYIKVNGLFYKTSSHFE